ncbi:uncharacterized protein LOC115625084 [Scaptodrosophila lebanonensis]|uniref:Uncharacterized protein LOC115625084 n=1 Tax=Drosophila lebanonensis TaxID=7225 RepID=A0A6J2TK44_DROLE|nr:uncharacterized protein LOC115625084 [Scaptodrosophila lebanonensis]
MPSQKIKGCIATNSDNFLQPMKTELCKNKKKRKRWNTMEESCFLDVWHSKLPLLRNERKNGPIYIKMVNELADQGVFVTVTDIKTKIDTVTRKFRVERDKDKCSNWIHYAKMAEILGPAEDKSFNSFSDDTSDTNFNSVYLNDYDSILLDDEETKTKREVTTIGCVTSTKEVYENSERPYRDSDISSTQCVAVLQNTDSFEDSMDSGLQEYEFGQLVTKELERLEEDLRVDTKRKVYNLICDAHLKQLQRNSQR